MGIKGNCNKFIIKSAHFLLLGLAVSLFFCGKPEKEVRTQAVLLNDRAVEIRLDKPDSALYLLDQAIQLDPDYYLAYSNKSSVLLQLGQQVKAIEALKNAVELKPELAEMVVSLGMLYDYTNKPEKAKAEYQKALQLFTARIKNTNKHLVENKMNRAMVLLLLGDKEQGQKEIDQLLQADPENELLQMLVQFDKEEYFKQIFEGQ